MDELDEFEKGRREKNVFSTLSSTVDPTHPLKVKTDFLDIFHEKLIELRIRPKAGAMATTWLWPPWW